VREDDGPWLPESVPEDPSEVAPTEDRDSLYAGIAGLAPVLAEVTLHRPLREEEQSLARRVVDRLSTMARNRTEPSLYDGLAGDVTALRMLAPGAEAVAMRRLADLATSEGWRTTSRLDPRSDAPARDIVVGTAGVVLAAIWAGGEPAEAIAVTGAESLLRAAEQTPAGVDWAMLPGWPARMPNYSHGTAGVAAALAVAGTALDRPDLVEAAIRGAQHVVAVGSLDDGGFVVPHTIPPSRREVEPVTYGWCHGPTGTSYLFAALSHAGVAEVSGREAAALRQRCLHSVLDSGIPQRLRPGFWDNDGRCCGTAGVGEALLDAVQDSTDPEQGDALLRAARRMGDALVERTIRDGDGARWRFLEHRADPPLLPPATTWMQGASGIAAFLLRLARVVRDGPAVLVVDRPDQWWAVPAPVRTVHTDAPRPAPAGEAG
jgi:lantibiotic modifying enzyme